MLFIFWRVLDAVCVPWLLTARLQKRLLFSCAFLRPKKRPQRRDQGPGPPPSRERIGLARVLWPLAGKMTEGWRVRLDSGVETTVHIHME